MLRVVNAAGSTIEEGRLLRAKDGEYFHLGAMSHKSSLLQRGYICVIVKDGQGKEIDHIHERPSVYGLKIVPVNDPLGPTVPSMPREVSAQEQDEAIQSLLFSLFGRESGSRQKSKVFGVDLAAPFNPVPRSKDSLEFEEEMVKVVGGNSSDPLYLPSQDALIQRTSVAAMRESFNSNPNLAPVDQKDSPAQALLREVERLRELVKSTEGIEHADSNRRLNEENARLRADREAAYEEVKKLESTNENLHEDLSFARDARDEAREKLKEVRDLTTNFLDD